MEAKKDCVSGFIYFRPHRLHERTDYYRHCMNAGVPYICITQRRKFSEVFYDTRSDMESKDAQRQIITHLRELSRSLAWPKGSGFGCTSTFVGDIAGTIFRVPNESGPAVAKVIMNAFCSSHFSTI